MSEEALGFSGGRLGLSMSVSMGSHVDKLLCVNAPCRSISDRNIMMAGVCRIDALDRRIISISCLSRNPQSLGKPPRRSWRPNLNGEVSR